MQHVRAGYKRVVTDAVGLGDGGIVGEWILYAGLDNGTEHGSLCRSSRRLSATAQAQL